MDLYAPPKALSCALVTGVGRERIESIPCGFDGPCECCDVCGLFCDFISVMEWRAASGGPKKLSCSLWSSISVNLWLLFCCCDFDDKFSGLCEPKLSLLWLWSGLWLPTSSFLWLEYEREDSSGLQVSARLSGLSRRKFSRGLFSRLFTSL